ncbi:expressed unknown protein [Seminavis robusta]|uniref:Uncharacterized protein n=1 Tax=Seminavis robusta TaxID=568900 RepID=A0A9N8E2D7_9STRA|nr:expressed unknown protein [Seminavis robusta]|eukprot:Sro584_g170761.1  (245) ;mRNA; f:11661-12395
MQGNGASPMFWVDISAALVACMKDSGFSAMPIACKALHFAGFLFVDDAANIHGTDKDPNTSAVDFLQDFQDSVNCCIGGCDVSVGGEDPGFIRNGDNETDTKVKHRYIIKNCLLPWIDNLRVEGWKRGTPIPENKAAVAWCDGDIAQLSTIANESTLSNYRDRKIHLCKQSAARSATSGCTGPVWMTIAGFNDECEPPKDQCKDRVLVLQIDGLCVGGGGVSVSREDPGFVVLFAMMATMKQIK